MLFAKRLPISESFCAMSTLLTIGIFEPWHNRGRHWLEIDINEQQLRKCQSMLLKFEFVDFLSVKKIQDQR